MSAGPTVGKLSDTPIEEILEGNLTLRPEMVFMAKSMEHKLKMNDHKRPWASYTPTELWWLIAKLKEEVRELEDALTLVSKGELPYDEVMLECADVSNFSLMIHDVVRRYKTVETP